MSVFGQIVDELDEEVLMLQEQRDHARKIAGRCFRVCENVGVIEMDEYLEPDPHDGWTARDE